MSHIAWGKNWIGPYESQVTVLWKMAWANQWTSRDLKEHLQLGDSNPRWLWHAHSPSDSHLAHIRLQENDERFTWNQLVCTNHGHGVEKLFGDAPRFCDECLRVGYHSYLHQFLPLARCPIHGKPLRRHCCCCEMLVPTFMQSRDYAFAPFHCGRCAQPLGVEFQWRLLYQEPSFRKAAKDALGPLNLFLQAVGRSPFAANIRADAPFLPYVVRAGDGDDQADQAVKFFHALCDLIPAQIDLGFFYPRPAQIRAVRYEKVRLEYSAQPDGSWNPELLARFKAVYKSVRRHVRKRLQVHCRSCVKAVAAYVRWHVGIKTSIHLSSDLCPLGQAYLAWSLRLGDSKPESTDYLAFERKDRMPFRWEAWYRQIATRDNDLHLFAWQTLAGFYAVVTSVARYLEVIRGVDDTLYGWIPLQPVLRSLDVDAPPHQTESCDITYEPLAASGTRGILIPSDAALMTLENLTRSRSGRNCSFNQRFLERQKRYERDLQRRAERVERVYARS